MSYKNVKGLKFPLKYFFILRVKNTLWELKNLYVKVKYPNNGGKYCWTLLANKLVQFILQKGLSIPIFKKVCHQ